MVWQVGEAGRLLKRCRRGRPDLDVLDGDLGRPGLAGRIGGRPVVGGCGMRGRKYAAHCEKDCAAYSLSGPWCGKGYIRKKSRQEAGTKAAFAAF